jgi:hypothetical protein
MKYFDFNKLREISLCFVLIVLYKAIEVETNHLHVTRKFNLISGHKIAVTDHKWIDNTTHFGGYGALDLVIYLSSVSLNDAAQYLESIDGLSIDNEKFKCTDFKSTNIPAHSKGTWSFVKTYLTDVRKIPESLINIMHAKSLIWSDKNRNCVFPRDLNSGAYLRGTLPGIPFKLTIGRNGRPYVIPGDDLIIITEAPIDAISLKYYYPTATVLATGGRIGFDKIEPYLTNASKVLFAQDNDPAGEEQARNFNKVIKIESERLLPKYNLKDWNDVLKFDFVNY